MNIQSHCRQNLDEMCILEVRTRLAAYREVFLIPTLQSSHNYTIRGHAIYVDLVVPIIVSQHSKSFASVRAA